MRKGKANFYIKLFADDTFLCAQNEDLAILEKESNEEIEKVYQWLASNKLTLNITKSKFMLVTNKRSISHDFRISINDTSLEQCDKYKYLGVILDKKLSWKPHVEYISTKISKACGALAKIRHYLDTNVLVEIYHALIHTYVRYGILAWGVASESTRKPLQTLLNRALRIMCFAPFGRIDIEPLYKDLNILDVDGTFILETSKFMFKQKKGLLPESIGDYFIRPSPENRTISYNLRTRNRISHIPTRLVSSDNSIHIRGEKIWDSIPEIVSSSSSLQLFKRQLKDIVIDP